MNVAKPLLQQFPPWIIPPFLLNEQFYHALAQTALLKEDMIPPSPSWMFAKKDGNGEKIPQAIAHRGYKAEYPENTMGAFEGAVEVGAHAVETDLHISKDNVVILSHDATLKRCYGIDRKVIECDWEFLSKQRTVRAPHQPMPRLIDLLDFLAKPGLESIWLLLDIKLTNDAENIMRLIASTIASVPPSPSAPWNQRIVLGCWAAKFLPLCAQYLPAYPITHIGFSIPYARGFLSVPNVSFNTLQGSLAGPLGSTYIRDLKTEKRPLLVWTVNSDYFMRWSIDRGLDGVITDDPKRFLEVAEEWECGKRDVGRMTWPQWGWLMWQNFMVVMFGLIFQWKFGGSRQGEQIRKAMTMRADGQR